MSICAHPIAGFLLPSPRVPSPSTSTTRAASGPKPVPGGGGMPHGPSEALLERDPFLPVHHSTVTLHHAPSCSPPQLSQATAPCNYRGVLLVDIHPQTDGFGDRPTRQSEANQGGISRGGGIGSLSSQALRVTLGLLADGSLQAPRAPRSWQGMGRLRWCSSRDGNGHGPTAAIASVTDRYTCAVLAITTAP